VAADPQLVADLIGRSDERDLQLELRHQAYRDGYNHGRATACVALAEIEERYQSVAIWRGWAARLRRIIQAETDPSVRMIHVMAEIHADQAFMREARKKLVTKPRTLSPLEWCALNRIRLADPGDEA
jgi:hypothetical protein